MAFFSIVRYTEEESSDKQEDRSQDILKKLHQAADKKRKSLQTTNDKESESLSIPSKKLKQHPEKSSSPKKKKKLSSDQESDSLRSKHKDNVKCSDGIISDSSNIKETPSKKKKKAKHEADVPEENETLFQDSPIKRKKKAKTNTSTEADTELEHDPNNYSSDIQNESTIDDAISIISVSDKDKVDKKARKKKHRSADESITNDSQIVKKINSKTKRKKRSSETSTDVTDSEDNQLTIEPDEDENIPTDPEKIPGNSPQQSHDEIGGFTVIGNVQEKKLQKVQRVLPDWLAAPSVITDNIRKDRTPLSAIKGLDQDLINKLTENGIKDFFPVQGKLLPVLLKDCSGGLLGNAGFRPQDICCSAPTGSGKTLAYVLPIVQALRGRCVPQVRALIVLPVRELVTQVYNVFSTYNMGLKVAQLIGKASFASTQQMLVKKTPRGYQSQVDILVTTPGRLVDHINNTPGFTLKHLRFLVIDEADRMMDEIDHDWLNYVENAVFSGEKGRSLGEAKIYGDITRVPPGPLTAKNAMTPQIPLQKLLFSATLSQNPEKLQLLNLFQPSLFTCYTPSSDITGTGTDDSQVTGGFLGKYTTPVGLTEYYIEATAGEKPLVLMYLLHHLRFRHILCFTNTVEATHRLYWLLKLTGIKVREISSDLHANRRSRMLKLFSEGSVDILICSDAMARGMDIDNVKYVLSYDMPPYLKTYIHRVGRTARAGKAGIAISLLEQQQLPRFRKMLSSGGKDTVEEFDVTEDHLEPFVEAYTDALRKLPQMLKAVKR